MAVVRWKNGEPGTPEAYKRMAVVLTEQAISDMGGLGRFVKKGASVWLKPNINFHRTSEFAANTNPDVVATMVRLCLEAGAANVRVGDHSAFGADKSYPMSGIEDAVKAAGGEMVLLDPNAFKEYSIGGKVLTKWALAPQIMESDIIINMPVAKNHPLPKYSGCMKNLMGIAGGDRNEWHKELAECLCDINTFVKPTLHVMDMMRCILSGPPRGGSLDDIKFFGLVAAGIDPVALDAFGAELLGKRPADIAHLVAASGRNMGQIDYRKLVISDTSIG